MATNIVGQYFCTDCGREAERWMPKNSKARKQNLLENDPKCSGCADKPNKKD